MKKLSVIVAAFKAAPYVGAMLESFDKLKRLSGWEYELRIGVDACDETARELDILGVEYWKTQRNVGAYVMRNSLIALYPADMYAIFDADDILEPDYFFKLIPEAEKSGFSCSHKRVFMDNQTLEVNRGYGGGQCVFTHELLEKLGGFRSDRVSSDLDFTLRAMISGVNISIIPEPLWNYRRLATSLTGNPATDCRSSYRAEIEARQDILRCSGNIKITPEKEPLYKSIPWEKSISPDRVSIIVFTPDGSCPYRKRNWEWLKPSWLGWGFEVIEITGKSGNDFNKAMLAHAGAAAAHGDVLVFADADVFMDRRGLARAIGAVCSGSFGWAAPNSHVCRYTDEESESTGNGGAAIPSNAPYIGQLAGGLFVISRKCWDEVGGMDTRFTGWGGEDSAFSVVLAQRGDGWKPRKTEILWHLWHPEQSSKVPGKYKSKNNANNELLRQYQDSAAVDKKNNQKGAINMEVRITSGTRINGRHCEAGTVENLDNQTAFNLIRWGQAVPVENEGRKRDSEAVNTQPEITEVEEVTPPENTPKMKVKHGNSSKRK